MFGKKDRPKKIMYTFKPEDGFMRKFLRRSSNIIVFLEEYCGYLPQITPRGFV